MTDDRPPLAAALDLRPHPEGGWFRQTWRSGHAFLPDGYPGPRDAASLIYFALFPGEESAWHVVRSDEIWLWHRGGPAELRLGGDGDEPITESTVVLGSDVENGQVAHLVVPAGHWQATRLSGHEPVLVSCVVAPGFEFEDFRLR